jgi:hypothetical protein
MLIAGRRAVRPAISGTDVPTGAGLVEEESQE